MKKQMIADIFVLALLAAFLYFLFQYFTPEVLLAFIAGLTPTVVLLYLQNRKEKRDHHNWLLRSKEACFVEIFNIFISLAHAAEEDTEERNKKLRARLMPLQTAILAWGSPSFLLAWTEMQKLSADDSMENTIRKGERFYRAIRKELGHDDSSLAPGQVWGVLLTPDDRQEALDVCKGEVYK